MNKTLVIHPIDTIAVALTGLKKGESISINNDNIVLLNDISAKHKFALLPISKNEQIFMYGVTVGKATVDIAKGDAITTKNIHHASGKYDDTKGGNFEWLAPDITKWKDVTFDGYHRTDGQVGTANYWLIFPLVFCENRNVEIIKKAFVKGLGLDIEDKYDTLVKSMANSYRDNEFDPSMFSIEDLGNQSPTSSSTFSNVDGIRFLTHQGGCGGTRQDSETLCRLLAGYVNNPNVAGATILSLGCQNAEVDLFNNSLNAINPNCEKPLLIFDQQEEGTERDLVSKAIIQTFTSLTEVDKIGRKPAPLSKLSIGLECGGSDGFSGISANPAIGYTSDLISALGGKAILSEFPELCGVEQELINRSANSQIAKKFSHLMRSYEKAAEKVGSGFDMNPSPGNIKDGLITDAMKSAGAAKKGGTSPVNDVLDYTEYVKNPGLSLLCTPGNDVESTTGLAGSGANIILFTTGLGTPTGNPICPVIKVASNSKMANKMADIIDINTGEIISGEKSIEEVGREVLALVIEVASGKIKTKADHLQQYDFIPWKRGVSL